MKSIASKLKSYLPDLIYLFIFFVIASIFFFPLYEGKVLRQSDNIHLGGTGTEWIQYAKEGELIRWTNKEFSGMPLLQDSSFSPYKTVLNVVLGFGLIPPMVAVLCIFYLGFYILLRSYGVRKILAAIGSLAYAFSSFIIISIEVGHDNKVYAMAFIAVILAGVIRVYKGRLIFGLLLTYLGAGCQLHYNHVQITYYTLLLVLIFFVSELIICWKSGSLTLFGKRTLLLFLITVFSLGTYMTSLISTWEYGKYSTRGGSELTKDAGGNEVEQTTGLDKDYAFQWSNGIMETFTIMFPYFHGGASGEELDNDSETAKALSSRGANPNTAVPLYWGDQPFTQGPIYFGILVCTLFVIGIFVLDKSLKVWMLVAAAFFLILTFGKNMAWFNYAMFDYFPLYNKFRSVTMAFAVVQLVVPLMGFIALNRILTGTDPFKAAIKPIGVVVGISLFFLLFKSAFFDFVSPNDSASIPQWLLGALKEDRIAMFNSDIIRALVFVLFFTVALWAFAKRSIKYPVFIGIVGLLVLVDMWSVDRRYIDPGDFQRKRASVVPEPTMADRQILADQGFFRVFNLTVDPFRDGTTSYHHYSVGGYSAIKLARYQDLIEYHLSKGNRQVLNMLNAKYFIVNDGNNQPIAQRNTGALGNAWFVREIELVDSPDQEIQSLNGFDPGITAIMDRRFTEVVSNNSFTGSGNISLESYHPENMVYASSTEGPQLAVFSEIYYEPGWRTFIDGEEVDHVRVNYVLRALEVPAGEHKIEFRYLARSSFMAGFVSTASFILAVILMLGSYFVQKKS